MTVTLASHSPLSAMPSNSPQRQCASPNLAACAHPSYGTASSCSPGKRGPPTYNASKAGLWCNKGWIVVLQRLGNTITKPL